MLKLYNTLSKKLEEIPKSDHLNLYTCGPTVYDYAHIGNLRAFIIADLLYRTLKHEGYNPKWVMNITDIDDKTIKGAVQKFGPEAGIKQLREYTDEYLQAFLSDLGQVNILKDEIEFIRVTDVMPQIQDFIIKLIDKGYAYKADDGSTYFSIEKYQKDLGDYGQLVGEKFLEGKKVGARINSDEYEKDNLSDFALWKAHTETDANIFWDDKTLGKGRPGWHIECSVINHVAFKGQTTDLHTGGVDLIFPHHTNEIAQSQALFGKGKFVNHWLHSEHLLVDGNKMSKSLNNFYTLSDLKQKGFDGLDLRYLLLSSSYRGQQNFTFNDLLSARTARARHSKSDGSNTISEDFLAALDDDLNFSKALGLAIDSSSVVNAESILGISFKQQDQEVPENIQKLLQEREQARQGKDFGKSDDLRKEIEDLGFDVKDTSEGQKVSKKLQI